MNEKEKLTEATILALQGKLNKNKIIESIEWKKDIHDKNYDYHNDENDRYRRFDYPDTVYDFGTFYIKGLDNKKSQKFSVTHMINSYKVPKFNNSWEIKPIHPYDEANYHWARAYEGDNEYKIYHGGKYLESIKVSDITSDSEIEKVAQRLLELDNPIEARISYND